MIDLWVAFITGLTTGGLSCMAVQGGLLAGSLANQIEQDISQKSGKQKKGLQPHIAMPIVLFLLAKLVAYTLLGYALGALGSVFQLTLTTRAIMQFTIGIFIIGNALRMFNVHPIFRFFSFEPPASLTRFIRRKSKNGTSLVTPIYLGVLTVLIPCGVTQTIMAAAVATANPLQGAALLFAFVLGTSPVFFLLSYFATRLSAVMEKYFVRIVATVLLVLGVLAVDTGLNLLGSPYSLTRLAQSINPVNSYPQTADSAEPIQPQIDSDGAIVLAVTGNGYEPHTLHAPANKPLKLNLVTNNTYSCARAFTIPELGVEELLAKTGSRIVEIPAQKSGKVLAFTCSMGMYSGEIVFEG
jgi:sulfite exporter TauE/SafE